MSNVMLGTVYHRIMEDVIEQCHTTFEEEGVDNKTLEELRSTWQSKLSALKVGSFPWEPPPAPQPMPNPATVPSNGPRASNLPSSTGSKPEPHIKSEPGVEPNVPASLPPNYGNNDARERAMANLSQKFGAQATSQIDRMKSQMIPNGQPYNGQPTLTPEQQREQQRERQLEYMRRQHVATAQQLQQAQYQQNVQHQQYPQPRPNPAGPSGQADGNADWNKYVNERRAHAAQSGQEADHTIRKQVEQMSRQNEGGGLMMPLSEQSDQPQAKRRKVDDGGLPQTDGADDDDDEEKDGLKDELFDDDEDAINSDLDDPDDNEIEEEPEDGKPTQVMLCTYDKVQRVKNKWKCSLRDGVLNSGGKEYVFGKANGEFEW